MARRHASTFHNVFTGHTEISLLAALKGTTRLCCKLHAHWEKHFFKLLFKPF